MRLIDADALAKSFKDCHVGVYRIDRLAQEIIDKQPTAFDKEKVVVELEENGQRMAEAKSIKPYGKNSPSCHRYYKAISVKRAIDIVKRGGVE